MLAVVLTGFFLILLDGTTVNVAIPPIQHDFGASYSAAQWMMGGYALAYGVLLIPAGRLGDRFGAKRLFVTGLAVFTVASLLCGVAADAAQLVLWRVVQGAGAGLMNPSILAMIHVAVPAGARRRAFARYGATAGVATAIGPALGGALVAADLGGFGWRPIFLLNLPVGVALLAIAARVLPEHRGRGGSIDPLGTVLLVTALLLLAFPLVQGHEAGWPGWVVTCLLGSVPAFALFIIWQVRRTRQRRSPLIDVRLFGSRSFTVGVTVVLCQFIAFASLQFVLSVHLQIGVGLSPAAAGLALVPFAVGTFVGSTVSAAATARFGRRGLHAGAALLAAGTAGIILVVRLADARVDGIWLAAPTFLAGAGAMLLGAPLLHIAQLDVPSDEAGAAGGVVATAQRIGHGLGVALVGTILFALLPAGAADSAPGTLATEFIRAAQVAAGCCLAFALAAFVLVFLLPARPGSSQPSPGQPAHRRPVGTPARATPQEPHRPPAAGRSAAG